MYQDFFLVFLVQNDKICSEMNKKGKIEARKTIFDMHKVFIKCTFVYSNMVINFVTFKFFGSKYRNQKKFCDLGLGLGFGLGLSLG